MRNAEWQSAYEWQLLKARRCCEDARAALRTIGASERKEEPIDAIKQSLKSNEETLSEIWERHYGSETEEAP